MMTSRDIQEAMLRQKYSTCWELYVSGCALMEPFVLMPLDPAAAVARHAQIFGEADGAPQLGDLVVLSGREAGTSGATWTAPGAGEKPGEHVGFVLDAFRFIHLVKDRGPVVCELATYAGSDPGFRLARPRSLAMPSVPVVPSVPGVPNAGAPICVRVTRFSSLIGHRTREGVSERQLRRATTIGLAWKELTGLAWEPEQWAVARNGQLVGGDATDGGNTMLADGDEIWFAPRPREITSTTLILLAVGLMASTLSSFLMPLILSKPRTSADAPGRQYGFDRYSRPAIAGEPMPVVLGPRKRYGGRVVASLPGEGSDGNTRLRMLIDLSAGPVNKIGSLSADTDRVDAAAVSGIYLNDTPIAQFAQAKVSVRMGGAGQLPIPGFGDIERLREVGVGGSPLANTSGVDRTGGVSGEVVSFSTDETVDSVIVRVRFPNGLFTAGGSGQVLARRVQYRVRQRTSDVGSGAGAWSAFTVVSVERAEQSAFISAFRIDGLGLVRYDVQVERVTAEPTSALIQDSMVWDSLLQIRLGDENYEGRAVLALELVAGEQLTTEPRVSIDIEGFKGLRIWDGVSSPSAPVFTTGYSDNPAWMALAIITNTTWGMGVQYGDANINFPKLIEWALSCDGLVPTAAGVPATRKRYRCGIVLGERRTGEEWLRTVCETGRCVPAVAGDVWTFIESKAQSPVEIFTDGSIAVDEASGRAMITYGRELSTKGLTRPNRVAGQFEDQALDGRANPVAWPPYGTQWLGAPTNEPVREEAVRLDGVFDVEQALQEVRYRAKRLRFLSRTVKFTPLHEVVAVQPGDRFDLATSLVGWGQSGRVRGGGGGGSTATAVMLDRMVTLAAGSNVLKLVRRDGAVETVAITSPAGTYVAGTPIDVAALPGGAPGEFDEYAVGNEISVLKPFTCTRVAVEDAGELRWSIEGIEYDAAVFDETAEAPSGITYSVLPDASVPPGPVQSLTISDRLVDNGAGGTKLQVSLAWAQSAADAARTAGFFVYWRQVGGETWIRSGVASVSRAAAVLDLTELDLAYQFKVVAFSSTGAALSPYDASVPIVELAYGLGIAPPAPPGGLSLDIISGAYTLSWDEVDDAVGYQVLYGGDTTALPNVGAEDCLVHSRYVGASPFGGRPFISNLYLAAGQGARFFVRSVSASGRLSFTASTISITAATPAGKSIKLTSTFALNTDGTRTNLTWDGGQSRLELTSPASDGVYLSPEVDTGSVTLSTLALRVLTANDAADPTIAAAGWAVPSIEADQWGVVSGSGSTAVVGMLMPPYPDDRQEFVVEVRTHDGVVWSNWDVWAHPHVGKTASFQKWQARITIRRDVAPYRPALRGLTGVVVH